MTASAPMLAIENLAVRFPQPDGTQATILERIDLTIAPGELVVLLGASGCGKSTLLNAVAGFLRPTQGAVRVRGRTIDGPGADRGVVLQSDALYPWLNARDNVAFGLRLKGVAKAERLARADDALGLVGLSAYGDHAVWQLSGGMRQRVSLARAVVADPEILLMDEPLGALDALTREQMQDLVLDVWQRTAKTVLFVTHGLDEALYLATRLVVLAGRPGRVVLDERSDFGARALRVGAAVKALPEFSAARERLRTSIFAGADA